MSDAVKGALWGILLGTSLGLGICVWILVDPLLFTGDTILIGGIFGAIAGCLWGEAFFDFVKDYWWRWWP